MKRAIGDLAMVSILTSQIHATVDGDTYAQEPTDGNLRKARPVDRTIDFGQKEQPGAEWLRDGRWVERALLPTRREVRFADSAVPRRLVALLASGLRSGEDGRGSIPRTPCHDGRR